MGKLVAAMNMTLDGFCDHTSMGADTEIHGHYTELLRSAEAIMWGRVTFGLMEFWPTVLENPTSDKGMYDFAVAADDIKKIVFSRTLESVDWRNTELKREIDQDEIKELKKQSRGDILVGSPSLIVQLSQLGLIDEYQLGVFPTVVGSGLKLFKNITERIDLKLLKTKTFECGAVFNYYEPKVN